MILNRQIQQHKQVRGGLVFRALPFGDIEIAPLPDIAHIPIDKDSEVSIAVGETVLTGQPLTHLNEHSVTCHASVSGEVITVTDNTVSIKSDGLDKCYIDDSQQLKGNNYQRFFRSMGLVGLGGAGFPVDKKLAATKPSTLLINAAECDPSIYCDEALMQERSAEIFEGIQIALKATGVRQCIIGIEANKTKAIEQMKRHLPDNLSDKIQLICVPAKYPSGAETTLLTLCTGKTGSLQSNQTICFNVATCYAMYQSVKYSKPLVSRIVSIVKDNDVRNLEVRIGTPLKDLPLSWEDTQSHALLCGGQMMGWPVTSEHCIDKRSNSILLYEKNRRDAMPCIRCAACEEVCPENLLPQQLFWNATGNTSILNDLKLDQCIECGCCDAVCPSHIPLAGLFSQAKQRISHEAAEQEKAARAKYRYEKRLTRLNEETVRQRKELDSKTAILKDTNSSEDAKRALIAKALKRKGSKSSLGSDNKPDRKTPQ